MADHSTGNQINRPTDQASMMQPSLSQSEEEQILALLRQGDESALAQLYDTYAPRIYRLAIGILTDTQQADTVVQETFIKLIKHIDQFEGRSRISTWLYRVAYNHSLGILRRARPMIDLDEVNEELFIPAAMVDWSDIPDTELSNQEAMQQVQNAIEMLSPALKAVFVLRDIEELSTRETASILQISESAVKVRLHRARLVLRETLAEYFEEYVQS